MQFGGCLFVESLQRPVMTFVEQPCFHYGQIVLPHFMQHQLGGIDGANQQTRVDCTKVHAGLTQSDPSGLCFGNALWGERHIVPASKEIQLVPCALTVSKDDQGSRHVQMVGQTANLRHILAIWCFICTDVTNVE